METKQKETIYFPCCPYGLFRCTSYQGAFTPCSVRRRATCKLVSLQRPRSGSTAMVLGTEKQTACSRDQPLLGVSRELATSLSLALERPNTGSTQKQPTEIMSSRLCWETCPAVPCSNVTALSSCSLYLTNSEQTCW